MSNKAIELVDKWDEMTEPYLQVEPSIALEHADLMAQELRSLHAEVEGLGKDAARYRWLRADDSDLGLVCAWDMCVGEELDQIIDSNLGDAAL